MMMGRSTLLLLEFDFRSWAITQSTELDKEMMVS
jgi:hypothetical protein